MPATGLKIVSESLASQVTRTERTFWRQIGKEQDGDQEEQQ